MDRQRSSAGVWQKYESRTSRSLYCSGVVPKKRLLIHRKRSVTCSRTIREEKKRMWEIKKNNRTKGYRGTVLGQQREQVMEGSLCWPSFHSCLLYTCWSYCVWRRHLRSPLTWAQCQRRLWKDRQEGARRRVTQTPMVWDFGRKPDSKPKSTREEYANTQTHPESKPGGEPKSFTYLQSHIPLYCMRNTFYLHNFPDNYHSQCCHKVGKVKNEGELWLQHDFCKSYSSWKSFQLKEPPDG